LGNLVVKPTFSDLQVRYCTWNNGLLNKIQFVT
jgi:hypothetical protein